jgi:hypothetical protein
VIQLQNRVKPVPKECQKSIKQRRNSFKIVSNSVKTASRQLQNRVKTVPPEGLGSSTHPWRDKRALETGKRDKGGKGRGRKQGSQVRESRVA